MVQAGQVVANGCAKATDFSEGETLGPGQNLGAVVSDFPPWKAPAFLRVFALCSGLTGQVGQQTRLPPCG